MTKLIKELIYWKASMLQPECNQVQKIDKLAEYNALRGYILIA